MNCSGLDPSSSDSVKVFEYVLFIYWLFGIMFLIFCIHPLIKLARERFALYILVSKLFPAILGLLSSILGHVLVTNFVLISQNAQQIMTMFNVVSNRFHIIALAANRAHAVFLPIHYRNNVTKRTVLLQCVILHLLSIILAPFYAFFLNFKWTYLIVSSSFYVAIAIRLAWIKANNRNGNNSQTSDKDSGRFTATCFAIQIIAWIYMSQNAAINTKWFIDFINCQPIGQIVYCPLQFILALYPISDELFLLLICEDMRKLFARMVHKIFSLNKTNATETRASNKVVYCNRVQKVYPIQCSNQILQPNTAQYGNQTQYASRTRVQMLSVSTTPYNRKHIKTIGVSGGISR
ncbi:hypothetical protein niasHS_007941 [Heterodera schachtii]|uniref:Uncharacterized protein n=1 Tax=Heterodera schachtii TaxID=97005 RepID=A0ABD2JQ24_HETSC